MLLNWPSLHKHWGCLLGSFEVTPAPEKARLLSLIWERRAISFQLPMKGEGLLPTWPQGEAAKPRIPRASCDTVMSLTGIQTEMTLQCPLIPFFTLTHPHPAYFLQVLGMDIWKIAHKFDKSWQYFFADLLGSQILDYWTLSCWPRLGTQGLLWPSSCGFLWRLTGTVIFQYQLCKFSAWDPGSPIRLQFPDSLCVNHGT